ncbi:MAG: thioesterase domain-containing protein [bacterium]|jgi:thioesterase domain-containing protein
MDFQKITSQTLQTLETHIFEQIPITQHLGFSITDFSSEQLILNAPLEQNINHKGTVFGGSLNMICTLAGWAMVNLIIEAMGEDAVVVVQKGTTSFKRPVTDDFQVICDMPDVKSLNRFQKMYTRKNVARIDLQCIIPGEQKPLIIFDGSYVATKRE